MHRREEEGHHRRARQGARLDLVCGTAEPLDEDAHAPVHPADERLLKEARQPYHALSLYFVFYNFARVHKSLRMSPAMAAGVADLLWSMEDIAALIDANEATRKKAGRIRSERPNKRVFLHARRISATVVRMDSTDTTKLIASTEAANLSPLVLGRNGEWWDGALLWSLAAAAIAAAIVFAATGGSVIAHKREAEASDRELEKYKSETERKVSDARQEGVVAGKTAGDALVRAAELEKEAAKSQERIAELEKDAAQLSADAEASKAEIAKANARAAEAQLALERFRAPRQLIPENVAAFEEAVASFAGTQVDVMVLGEGPEPSNLGNQIGTALFAERAGWKGRVFTWTGGGSAIGVAIALAPNADARATQAAAALAAALNRAGIDAAIAPWPGNWSQFGGFTAGAVNPAAYIRVVIGTKPT